MAVVHLDDPDDPRLDDYRGAREPELVKHRGRFIAEGRQVVEALLASQRFRCCSVLLAENKLGKLVVPSDVPTFVLPQVEMDRLVGFPIHRGVLGIGERVAELPVAAVLPEAERSLIVILEGVANHDNIGSIFRSAAGFGADAVLLDPSSADPLYRKAIRVSMGAVLGLPFTRAAPWPQAIEELRARGYAVWALTPSPKARPLDEVVRGGEELPPKLALMFGAEGPGLTDGALDRASARWSIPMAGAVDSLNVAICAAIALFTVRSASVK
jgi:tRNA G18 (ribose-2'-O)-methylase SpoU